MFEFDVVSGNDNLGGGEGHDAMIGDTGVIVLPTFFETPETNKERDEIRKELDDLLKDFEHLAGILGTPVQLGRRATSWPLF